MGELTEWAADDATGPRWLSRPRWLWRQAIEREITYRIHRLMRRPPEVWLLDLQGASESFGQLRGFRGSRG
jgi:hypothetical protein